MLIWPGRRHRVCTDAEAGGSWHALQCMKEGRERHGPAVAAPAEVRLQRGLLSLPSHGSGRQGILPTATAADPRGSPRLGDDGAKYFSITSAAAFRRFETAFTRQLTAHAFPTVMALCCGEHYGLDDWLLVDNTESLDAAMRAVNLRSEEDQSPLPLKARSITALLDCAAGVAEVKEQLTFSSTVDCSATFTFPVPGRSAVTRCVFLVFRHAAPLLLLRCLC